MRISFQVTQQLLLMCGISHSWQWFWTCKNRWQETKKINEMSYFIFFYDGITLKE